MIGTTLTLLASDAYNAYKNETGAVLDSNTGLLSITPAQFSKLKNLDFNIGGKTFTLNANAQIWPRSLNSAINGEKNKIYLIVSDVGSDSGSGLDFVMGFTWLYVYSLQHGSKLEDSPTASYYSQRFYTVYDSGKKQIGFAKTSVSFHPSYFSSPSQKIYLYLEVHRCYHQLMGPLSLLCLLLYLVCIGNCLFALSKYRTWLLVITSYCSLFLPMPFIISYFVIIVWLLDNFA